MKKTIVLDIKVKESNGEHFITIERMKAIPVNEAIQILNLKYATKGMLKTIAKVFNVAGEELDKVDFKAK